jgi:NADH-quinone oxidoreductase subunit F
MDEVRIALRNVGRIKPDSIEDYLAAGGYEALEKARTMDRGELIRTIEETSRLRGRGGAAFSTGKKWSSAFESKEETNTWSAMPTRVSREPTRTASSWRATPIR